MRSRTARFGSLLALCGLLLALLSGCSTSREKILVGTWETRDGAASLGASKALDNNGDAGALRAGMATLSHTDLTLKDDKTFSMGGTIEATGTWTFDKDTGLVTLLDSKQGGTLNVKLSDANQQIAVPNPTGQGANIILQKKDE